MHWFPQLFVGHSIAQSVVALSLAIAVGLGIGLIQCKGIRLGVGGVLFSGLALAHFGIRVEREILEFVREFGLILFVFAVGMQVGPGFLESLRRRGLPLNLCAAANVFLGVLVTLAVFRLFNLPMPVAVGLFSGAVTNTPSLSAASQVFREVAPDTALDAISSAGMAYAAAYPFGILGIILVMLLVKALFRINPERETEQLRELNALLYPPLRTRTFTLRNPDLFGLPLKRLQTLYPDGYLISCITEPGRGLARIPDSETPFCENMLVQAVGTDAQLAELGKHIGPPSSGEQDDAFHPLESRTILVSRSAAAGKPSSALGLTSESGLIVTRVVRAGAERPAGPDFRPHYGDRLCCLGEPEALDRAEAVLGNSAKALDHPHVLPIFLGILFGVVIGSIPVAVPGLPSGIKLGLAGGPLLVAIFLSRRNNFAGLIWYLPTGANLILRELGISLFLACVGLNSGAGFVDALVRDSGVLWMAAGACITFFPLMAAALLARLVFKYDFPTICGLLSGSMTDPPALAFAMQMLGSDAPSSVYATVYPLTMILRILFAQFLVLGFYYFL